MKNPVLTHFQALNEIKKAMQETARNVENARMRGMIPEDEYRIFSNDCEDFLSKVRLRMDRITPDLIKENKGEK